MSTELRQVESAECHCPCHNPLTLALHPVRCCETCPWCGRRIVCTTLPQVEDIENSYDHATFWRVAGIAFLISALATATFIAASAFVDYLDRVTD
jgi:hypothetical protein